MDSHRKEIQELKNSQAFILKQHELDVKTINKELNEEKSNNKMLETQLRDCKATIAKLK